MTILDTHVWLWLHLAPHKLSREARRVVAGATTIGIPAICCLELAGLAETGKIKLDRPTLEWVENALAEPRTELVPLTPAIAVTAARIGGSSLHDPADRIIAATALELQATLVTKDQKLLDFQAIKAVW